MRFPADMMGWLRVAAAVVLAGSASAQDPRRVTAGGVVVELRGAGPASAAAAVRVIEDQLALAGDSKVSAPLADDLAYFVQGRYFQLGQAEARVDWALDGAMIVLTVDESPRLVLGTITFSGTEGIPSDGFEAFLTRPTREREGVLARRLPFVEADLHAGAALVVRHLQAQGYLEATARELVFTAGTPAGAMNIDVTLESRSAHGFR